MKATTADKYRRLGGILDSLKVVAVAYSGGVDSSLLLRAALDRLGAGSVTAVTAISPIHPDRESQEAAAQASELGAQTLVIESDEMSDPQFVANAPDRCYHCKSGLLAKIRSSLKTSDDFVIVEGSNADDAHDYRPGRRAVAEHGVRSPLAEAGLTKAEIREISAELGLSTAGKSAKACLASRIPYGTAITVEALKMIDEAENALSELGFAGARVRHHGTVARIEVGPDEIPRALEPAVREKVIERVKAAGFAYVALDLEGYRTGSMNETLGDSAADGEG